MLPNTTSNKIKNKIKLFRQTKIVVDGIISIFKAIFSNMTKSNSIFFFNFTQIYIFRLNLHQ